MKIYIARDTESICIFQNKPEKIGIKDGFFYFVDPKSKEHLEIKEPPDDLKNHIGVGEMFEQELGGF